MVVITSWPNPVPLAVTSLLLTKLRGALKWVETATAYAAVSKADGSRVHAPAAQGTWGVCRSVSACVDSAEDGTAHKAVVWAAASALCEA